MFVATLQHLGWVTKFIIEHKLRAGIRYPFLASDSLHKMALILSILKDAWMRVHPITYRLSALKGYYIAYLKCCRKRNKITSNLMSNKVSFMAHVRSVLFGIESHNVLKFIIRIFHLNFFRSNSVLT